MKLNFAALILFSLLLNTIASAQGIQVTNLDGGSVVTELSSDNKVNPTSSLHRTWFAMNDPSCPIQISGAGIQIKYEFDHYQASATGTYTTAKEIRAYEMRYILFDTFGNYITTLSDIEVGDVSSGSTNSFRGRWDAEGFVSDLLTVVTFVAQVRTDDGSVWQYDSKGIGSELEKIKLKSAGVLEQKTKEK
jgi:hypothetical protein